MSGGVAMPTDRGDWPTLARAAERFLADRLSSDPRAVQASKLTPEAAQLRERAARAIVTIFTSVEQRVDIPALDISYDVLASDIAQASSRVSRLAQSDTDPALRAYATALAMIAEHCQIGEGQVTPAILLVHYFNQHHRALRAGTPKDAA